MTISISLTRVPNSQTSMIAPRMIAMRTWYSRRTTRSLKDTSLQAKVHIFRYENKFQDALIASLNMSNTLLLKYSTLDDDTEEEVPWWWFWFNPRCIRSVRRSVCQYAWGYPYVGACWELPEMQREEVWVRAPWILLPQREDWAIHTWYTTRAHEAVVKFRCWC